jgi:hypothetical protein
MAQSVVATAKSLSKCYTGGFQRLSEPLAFSISELAKVGMRFLGLQKTAFDQSKKQEFLSARGQLVLHLPN